jgi:hypothetical protein
MPEIDLPGKARQQIPAGGQNGENAGQNQDAQKIRIIAIYGITSRARTKTNTIAAGQARTFRFSGCKKLSQVIAQEIHSYLSSSN